MNYDYGMTESEFVDKMERQLTAVLRLIMQRFGLPLKYDVKVVKHEDKPAKQ